ncbi:rod shape-determining protein RodA [Heliorestis acidaminivorans]|uniref:Peptidoglycan glycosyltransferase RodA n=2 Tax=Heliorestis acidaminivorans TaxID=553427 RepID=A0A6I0EYL8_9FIRM|nr:rod shape-determining protein RodA [Heliorestis acidaminivorans]
MTFSLIVLSSASANIGADRWDFVRKQALWMGIGLAAAIALVFVSYQNAARYSWYLYGFTLLLLLSVIVWGTDINGSQRWIKFGTFQFQPSELAKLLLIVTFADFLSKRYGKLNTITDLLPCFLYMALPMALILIQPDLGTSLVLVAVMMGMLLIAGANKKILLSLTVGGFAIISTALAGYFFWGLSLPLQDYQIMRLVIFFNPDMDPAGFGYQIRQSLIAIGSGGLIGKGLYNGSQVQLNFLPEHHTDFIFAVVGEELGFIGAAALLLLFMFLILRSIRIALDARDVFGSLIVMGIASMLLFQVLVNVGMTISVMPITGLPLPFVSYGGTSMLTNMMALGLLLNVHIRRQTIMF